VRIISFSSVGDGALTPLFAETRLWDKRLSENRGLVRHAWCREARAESAGLGRR
jgi:hypothetical protein